MVGKHEPACQPPAQTCRNFPRKISSRANPFLKTPPLYKSHNMMKGSKMFYIKRNVPNWERLARLLLGIGLAVAAYSLMPDAALKLVSYIGAASLAATGTIGFCPACALVGRKLDRAK
jgi:hypothetical protein